MINVVFGLIFIVVAIVYFVKRKYSYFERNGWPSVSPSIPLGNADPAKHVSLNIQNVYNQLKGQGPIGGFYLFYQPFAVPLSMDSIKQIMIKDFDYFRNRGIYYNERDEPLSAHMISIENEKWRNLRTKLTPAFSSGKMKFMFPTIVQVGHELDTYLNELIPDNMDLEMKDILARFTTDTIGTCAFGIDCNSIKNAETEFRKMGRRAIEKQKYNPFILFILSGNIEFFRKLKVTIINDDVKEFFTSIVHQSLSHRKTNDTNRNDFLNVLMNLKMPNDELLTANEIAAQVFLFFNAGYETSSTTMTFALIEMAANPHVQKRCREEIKSVLQKHQNQLTYEAMMEMEYLDQVVHETLRKHPPVGAILRKANQNYPVPNSGITIPNGFNLFIPVYGIHHDPEYYPNPEQFDPDRFSKEMSAKRDKSTFLPFGDGPRNCIGMRFGLMQVKIGLITVLKNFEFSNCPKTVYPVTYSNSSLFLVPEKGAWFNVRKMSK